MKAMRSRLVAGILGAAVGMTPAISLYAADAPAPQAAANAAQDPVALAQSEINRGLEFLKSQQEPDGGWQQKEGEPPALTAIVLVAMVGDPAFAQQPFVKKGFDKLLTYQKEDGSISSDILATYNTAIATSAFAQSDDPKYRQAVDRAVSYLRSIEWTDKIQGVKDQNRKVGPNDPNYGGWGYGRKGRPDLSNESMAIEALHDAGLKPGDPAFDAAIKFISRSQNNSETNDQKWAGDDGGFIYTPADGGMSEVGNEVGPDGKRMLRSYGSMTYAGLKSMIYCGLTKQDPRVKAAWNWIRNNWTLEINPGLQFSNPKNPKAGESGLYYYYHTLARALRAYGQPVITDAKGNPHDWRVELIEQLKKEQEPDGRFVGQQRWMETRPGLATAFAVIAAEEALTDLKEHPAGR